jgi:hypothetical protein
MLSCDGRDWFLMNDLIVCARNCAVQPGVTPKLDRTAAAI